MSLDSKKINTVKDIRNDISLQLKSSLAPLQELLGSKKFDRRLKKAVKKLTKGIEKKNYKMNLPAKKKVINEKEAIAEKTTDTVKSESAVVAPTKVAKKIAVKKKNPVKQKA